MATVNDVAQLARVSAMTVSRTINAPDRVSPETRERVQKAIDELAYCPNYMARNLVRKYSRLVGVIYSNGFNEIYMQQISGIRKMAGQADYEVILSTVNNYESLVKAMNTMTSMQVDGFIVLPLELDDINSYSKQQESYSSILKSYHFLDSYFDNPDAKPCVFIGAELKNPGIWHVVMDYAQGCELALSSLLHTGVKDITYISVYLDKGIWKIRSDAYLNGMRKAGLDQYIHIERTENSVDGGYNCMHGLLQRGHLPEAVLCGNDYMAVGVIQALNQAGVKVPDTIKVIGQDGVSVGSMVYPKLTTVDLHGEKCGAEAMRLLKKAMENTNAKAETVVISQECVMRSTI